MSKLRVLVADTDPWPNSAVPEVVVVLGPDAPVNAEEVARRWLSSLLNNERSLVHIGLGPERRPITVVAGKEFADVAALTSWLDQPDDELLTANHEPDDGKWRHWIDGRSLGISETDPRTAWKFVSPHRSSALRRALGRRKRAGQRAQWRTQARPR